MSWLNQAKKGIRALTSQKKEVPDNLWSKCPACGEVLYHRELERNLYVCTDCGHHLRLTTDQYLDLLVDEGSWQESHRGITSRDPLDFKDSKRYVDRIKGSIKATGRDDAVVVGRAEVDDIPIGLAVMDFTFMGGSMGSVVGEKIARMLQDCVRERTAAVILSRSGGARMQESLLSLMQMAKTSAMLNRLHEEGLPFISLVTNPTTGGVTASYAQLGDVNIAEPGALIGFAGPRVIEQTINSELPEGFQSSEFLLEHGMLDMIVPRKELRGALADVLHWFTDGRDVSVPQPYRG
ncbi:acetyl-CoA carboxylase carboxyltransferase subunit beta [bacterium]|nr:acetyl-CoA carboxylase carboxyltransferase subunit beta [bacterium]HPF35806.1 acetyl-CoA carboxylase, carboxyltransferase subunit beta [Candidatus Krumholzibacteria bacterium]HRX51559.1 acetyl-CoA carboxylase, carboxyltransferase subunit beta [Candidatus Krumholzibacteria bacterium]